MMKKCKMCDNQISDKRIYCSNTCKHSDSELNKKRVRKEKNDTDKILQCQICGWKTKDILNFGGHPKKHLNIKHDIITDNYIHHFHLIDTQNVPTWKCPECGWESKDINNVSGWITSHVKKHYENIADFIEKYPNNKNIIQNL